MGSMGARSCSSITAYCILFSSARKRRAPRDRDCHGEVHQVLPAALRQAHVRPRDRHRHLRWSPPHLLQRQLGRAAAGTLFSAVMTRTFTPFDDNILGPDWRYHDITEYHKFIIGGAAGAEEQPRSLRRTREPCSLHRVHLLRLR